MHKYAHKSCRKIRSQKSLFLVITRTPPWPRNLLILLVRQRRKIKRTCLVSYPSDVLVSILEKLHLRDAVQVGVLSRRWRSLSHQLPRLALDWRDFLPGEEDYNYYEDAGDDEMELPEADTIAKASKAMLEAIVALLAARAAGETPACTLAVSFLLRGN